LRTVPNLSLRYWRTHPFSRLFSNPLQAALAVLWPRDCNETASRGHFDGLARSKAFPAVRRPTTIRRRRYLASGERDHSPASSNRFFNLACECLEHDSNFPCPDQNQY